MFEQICLGDFMEMEPAEWVPKVNDEWYIPSSELIPKRWEAWGHQNYTYTMGKDDHGNPKPYIINAVIAVLPGKRLYVKEWMMYPFMHELKSDAEVEKMYRRLRSKIAEWESYNSNVKRTWKLDYLPELEDMWWYKDGDYSCREYAQKMLSGYEYKNNDKGEEA